MRGATAVFLPPDGGRGDSFSDSSEGSDEDLDPPDEDEAPRAFRDRSEGKRTGAPHSLRCSPLHRCTLVDCGNRAGSPPVHLPIPALAGSLRGGSGGKIRANWLGPSCSGRRRNESAAGAGCGCVSLVSRREPPPCPEPHLPTGVLTNEQRCTQWILKPPRLDAAKLPKKTDTRGNTDVAARGGCWLAGMREFDVDEESRWEEATSAIRAYDPITGYGMQVPSRLRRESAANLERRKGELRC